MRRALLVEVVLELLAIEFDERLSRRDAVTEIGANTANHAIDFRRHRDLVLGGQRTNHVEGASKRLLTNRFSLDGFGGLLLPAVLFRARVCTSGDNPRQSPDQHQYEGNLPHKNSILSAPAQLLRPAGSTGALCSSELAGPADTLRRARENVPVVPADGRVRSRALPTLPYTSAGRPAATEGPGATYSQRCRIAAPPERCADDAAGEPEQRCDGASAAMPGVRTSDYAGCSLVRLVQMAGQSLELIRVRLKPDATEMSG